MQLFFFITTFWTSAFRKPSLNGLHSQLQWQEDTKEVVFHWQKGWLNNRSIGGDLIGSELAIKYLSSVEDNIGSCLDWMDLKPNHTSPVLTDPVPVNNSRLGLTSNITPYSPQGPAYPSSSMHFTISRRKPIPSKLDDVCHGGWLDAMKSSSPPCKKLNKDCKSDFASVEQEVAYRTWMVCLICSLM